MTSSRGRGVQEHVRAVIEEALDEVNLGRFVVCLELACLTSKFFDARPACDEIVKRCVAAGFPTFRGM